MNQAIFRGYDRAALDAQYDNRAKVPAYPAYLERYRNESETARARFAGGARLDVRVGNSEIESIDLFPAAGSAPAPVLVFIHGGYWMALDKADFSFVANGFVPHGVTTVVINYALIPSVRMDEVVRQCRQAVAWVMANAQTFGGNPERVAVAGHSAGGHLTAMVGATDWARFAAPKLPGPVRHMPVAGYAISGLHDLEPISLCYLQEKLQLSPADVQRNSPIHLDAPVKGAWLAFAGGAEGPEYARQSEALAAHWQSTPERQVSAHQVPGHDHFSIVMALNDPQEALTIRIADDLKGR